MSYHFITDLDMHHRQVEQRVVEPHWVGESHKVVAAYRGVQMVMQQKDHR